ncbi:MAG: YCF48-related protein, partial [bacterium]
MASISSHNFRLIALLGIVLLLGVEGAGASDGEWILQRFVPYDIDVIRDVSFLENGQTGWVVGYSQYGRFHFGSTILKTIDGGTTWTEQEIGLTNINEAVHFTDALRGWIVGSNGGIAFSSDGGDSWVPQASGTDARLKDVYFVNDTVGWAVGDYTILYTSNGGELWQGAGVHYGSRLRAVTFQTVREGWAVGSNGAIYHTTDGGSEWTTVESPTSEDLCDIFFIDEETGWIAGKSGTILSTEDGGSTWGVQWSGPPLNGLFFTDEKAGWAVGSGGTVLFTEEGGKPWVPIPAPASATLYGVHFFDRDRGLIFGAGGVLLRTGDGGASWRYVMDGPNANLTDVSFVDSKNGWACGWSGTILRTTDGGERWVAQRCGLDALLMGVDFIDLQNGWVVTFEGGMVETEEGGVSWSSVQAPAGTFRGLDYIDQENIWVVGEHSGLGSIWHGPEWRVRAQVPMGGPLQDVCFADRSNGWAVGVGGTILHTSDGGQRWVEQRSGTTEELTHIQAVNSETAWVSGKFDGLIKTVNGGQNWTIVRPDPSYIFGPIAFPTSQTGWVVGRSKTDGSVVIFHTTNGGGQWGTTPVASKEGFTAVDFVSPFEGWAVGEKGTIWYFTDLPFHSISGRAIYCDNLEPIPGVTLDLSGNAVDTVITDEEGTFRFDRLRQSRNFCVEPHMAGAPRQVITSFDASLILRSMLGQYPLSSCDSVAADVTGNDQVGSFDVSTILRYVVGQELEGLTGRWTFLPEEFCYPDLQSDQTDQIFRGIIYGDVTQNWPGIPDTGVPEVSVSLPHTGAAAGSDFFVYMFASPITYTCLDSLDILSYQARIDYDPSLLRVTAVSDTGLVTEGWGPLVSDIDNDNGHLYIAKAGTFPLPWCGGSPAPLVIIHSCVDSKAPSGATSPLTMTTMIFNEGTPWAETRDGFFQVLKHTISGTVSYCSTEVEVPDVLLSLAGDASLTASTDETGWYGFHGLDRGGDYCVVTISKSGVPKHVVTSFDASLILRRQAGTYELDDCGTSAADVNGDGTIDFDDALLISQYAVGERSQGRAGVWAFTPQGSCYEDLPSDQTYQNYEAFVYGDVSGNYPGAVEPSEAPWIHVVIPDQKAGPGATIGLSVVIDSFSGDRLDSLHIYACDLQLNYDPSLLSALLVSSEGLVTEDWGTISSRIDEATGLVSIGMTGAAPLSHGGFEDIPLARIEFYVNKEVAPGTETIISIPDAIFNEGSPKTYRTDGHLRIQGKSISGTVRYCDSEQSVGGVVLQLQLFGLIWDETETDSDGEYSFSDLYAGGDYCVSPIRAAPLTSGQRVISSYDAALISRHVVHLLPFSACDSVAADVSGDGTISPYDASIILQYVVSDASGGSPLLPGQIGTWHFQPTERCFTDLTYNETSDYEAVLYGDVSQNWPGLRSAKAADGAGLQIGRPKVTPGPKNSFALPIGVDNPG